MLHPASCSCTFPEIVNTLRSHWKRAAVPSLMIFTLVLAYAAIRSSTWEASLPMLVRDEASGDHRRPGRFRHLDEMKTVQETILELVKSREVLEAALRAVGPRAGHPASTAWPSPNHVEQLRSAISLRAPGGAEFGRTEVLYLKVEDRDPQRAVQLAEAVFAQLDRRFGEVRNQRAGSLVGELTKTVELAEHDLAEATWRVEEIEAGVGQDLGELRTLSESFSGESNLRRNVTEVENALRQATVEQKSRQQLLRWLESVRGNPELLVASPPRLLESQPALRRLRDGLVDAQLATSKLLGGRSPMHPEVLAARGTEAAVRQAIRGELAAAAESVQAELQLEQVRIGALEKEQGQLHQRMSRLASDRAEYQNRLSEVQQRRDVLNRTYQDLAEARASQAAARSTSLIAPLDAPHTGPHPLGPGRTTIAMAGLLGGLLTGVGIVFLTAPLAREPADDSRHGVVEIKRPPITRGGAPISVFELVRGSALKQCLLRISRKVPCWN